MKNKKKLISALSIVCAIALIFTGAFAFFSDSATLTQTSKVGEVDINVEGGLFHSNRLNNLNPGDNDPDVPRNNRPGTDHELSLEVDNLGNKSIIFRTLIEVSATKKDGTAFTAEELMSIILSEKQNVTTVTNQNNISLNDADKYTTITRLESTGYNDDKLIYIIGGTTENGNTYVLNGTGNAAELESGVNRTSTVQTIDIGLDKNISSDAFEGANIVFSVIVQAMQYRNTSDADWETIFNDAYKIQGAPETESPEFKEDLKVFAVYSADDKSLSYYQDEEIPAVNTQYYNKIVTKTYTGFEDVEYATKTTLPWFSELELVEKVVFVDEIKPISLKYWFSGMINCKSMDLVKLNTKKVTSLYDTFYKCERLSVLDLSNFDTRNVTNMDFTFQRTGQESRSFVILGLEDWDVSKVTTMRATFSHCAYKSLTFDIGDLSNWDVSNVTKMGGTSSIVGDVLNHYGMFGSLGHNAKEFKLKGIEHWDVSNVTDMAGMFSSAGYSASSFDIGDLSNWDVSNVTDLNGAFLQTALNAETVKIGDLSKWNTENCTSMIWTFSCFAQDATYSLDLSDWNVAKVTNHLDFNLNVKNQIISPWD